MGPSARLRLLCRHQGRAVLDNLKTAVLERVGDARFASTRRLWTTPPSTPGSSRAPSVSEKVTKGRVERRLYLRTSLFPCPDLDQRPDLNAQALAFTASKLPSGAAQGNPSRLPVQAAWKTSNRLHAFPQPPRRTTPRDHIGGAPYAHFDRSDYSSRTADYSCSPFRFRRHRTRICGGRSVLAVHQQFRPGRYHPDPAHVEPPHQGAYRATGSRRPPPPHGGGSRCSRLSVPPGRAGASHEYCIARLERLLDLFEVPPGCSPL
jgi:hypothetical protein